MTRQQEWWFVSDLHLDTGTSADRRVDEVLPLFLATTVGASRAPRRHLVLLGDFLELDGASADDRHSPVRRIEALADHHAGIVEAVGDCLRSGVTIHIVCGNHDADLARPEVQGALAGRLGGSSRLRFHPWFLHEPGVLYAEHGHQHHELNRSPTLLEPSMRDGLSQDQRMSVLQAWSHANGTRRLPTRAVGTWRAVRHTRRAESHTETPAYTTLLMEQAAREGLPPAAVRELAAASAFTVPASLARAGARAVGRRLGRSRPGDYMKSAAARVDDVLAGHGCRVPAYVFGHTHRAESTPLGDGTARYLNSGTWGPDVRGAGPDREDPNLFPYVHVRAADGAVECGVDYWKAPADRRRP